MLLRVLSLSGLAEMPKKRRSLIGYVRPKKRALSEEEEALEEPPITNDLDPIPEEVAPMPPEASLSAMSIADGGSNDAPPQESQKSMLSMLKADYHRTLRKAAVAHGRWCKTARTHFNAEHGGARWATESERQRVIDRLQKADDERLEAKRLYTDAHRALVLYRSMKNAEKRAKMEPDGLSKAKLQVLALRMGNKFKLHDNVRARHALDVQYDKLGPRTPMCTGDQIELLCAHAGLAQAYQWVHLSELI